MPARLTIAALTLLAWAFWAWASPSRPSHAAPAPPPEAIFAFRDGRYEEALAALPIDGIALDPEALYLRARALFELRRPGEALDTLPVPPEHWPEQVKRDVAALRVRWAADAGRCSALEQAAQSEPQPETTRLLGRCLFAAGDFARAKLLLGTAKDAQARGMVIRAMVSLGETEAALPLARALYIEQPAHAEAKYCQELLSKGPTKLRLSVEEHLTRADGFLKARRTESAFDELKGLDKRTPKALRARLWHTRGDALFKMRNRYPEAERAFTQATLLGGETEAYDAFHAIRAASRAGKDSQAIPRYRAYAKRYPKSPLMPDAVYLSAWLSARQKSPKAREALKQFAQSDVGKRAPGLRRDATWDLAWLSLEQGDAHDAARWLEEVDKLADRPLWAARVSYWQGRAAQLKREPQEARKFYQKAVERDRLGYYAQLAVRKLRGMGEPAPEPFSSSAAPLAAEPVLTLPPEAVFYRELGLGSEAADAAKKYLASLPDRYARAAALRAMGDAAQAHVQVEPVMQDILARAPIGEQRWLWEALLPRPYETSVNLSTAQEALSSALFYGHMQVESRYKPRAVSGADALGLMQLLPSTAAAVAKGLSIPADRGSLMRPVVNISLGARYLSGLIRRYQDQLPLAIAAYNAGTSRVDSLLPAGQRIELDYWVERMPIEQTRNYIRRVLSAYSRYRALEEPGAVWDLPIPEHVSLRTK